MIHRIKMSVMISAVLSTVVFAGGDIDTYEEEPVKIWEQRWRLPLEMQKYVILERLSSFNRRDDEDADKQIMQLMKDLVLVNAYIHRPEILEEKRHS